MPLAIIECKFGLMSFICNQNLKHKIGKTNYLLRSTQRQKTDWGLVGKKAICIGELKVSSIAVALLFSVHSQPYDVRC